MCQLRAEINNDGLWQFPALWSRRRTVRRRSLLPATRTMAAMRQGGDHSYAGLALRVLPSLVAALLVAALFASAGAHGSTPATPVVVIDPGHDLYANSAVEPIGPGSSTMKIKDGGGASGAVSHTPEAVVNMAVSRRLKALLENAGLRVVMTRTSTSHVSMGNIARAQIANRLHAAAFVRVHCDGSTNPRDSGTHTLYPAYHRGWTDDIYARARDWPGSFRRGW